jgi:DNA-binding NarL/FixJ family response regulator
MNAKIRVAIADDHQLFLDGLKLIFGRHPSISIVEEALTGGRLLEVLDTQEIDLVITDLSMPGYKGIDLVKAIKHRHPQVKVIVLTMHNEEEIVSEILHAEAEGYILKNSPKADLLAAVNDIIDGKTHYDEEVLNLFLKRARKEKKTIEKTASLTERELEVLGLIMQEFTSREIAEKLFISKQTVDTHRINIMQKTGAKTLVGLIRYAASAGMF